MDDPLSILDLQEVDSLEATVIIDNELDPMSPPAPDTVRIAGQMGTIAFGSDNQVTDRGDATKELRMGDICCSAHGLSILIVCTSSSQLRQTVTIAIYLPSTLESY